MITAVTSHKNWISGLPPRQQAIHFKSVHPSGSFTEITEQDLDQSLTDRFEKIVNLHPEKIAVKTTSGDIAYAELNALANRVARAIIERLGNGPEPVGISCDNGIPLQVAMLGVWKAGKIVVLLDPASPAARIASLLENSQARLVIGDKQNVSSMPQDLSGCQTMDFESLGSACSPENLRLQVPSSAFACIYYTSGTTGDPKAVIVSHRNLLHQILLFTNAYHFCAADRIPLLHSNTGNAVHNAILALLNGAMLLPFDVKVHGVGSLASWLSREKITICLLGAPLFRSLCGTMNGHESFPDLRFIRLRSDTVYRSDVDLYKKYFPRHCVLANGLSSTETGFITIYLMDHESEITEDEVPVGYAVEGKEILLLRPDGEPVGLNEVGEIVVRSGYVSAGYWRRPDLTDAKFKFSSDPERGEQPLYFTGDLGLRLSDGSLVHKGRKDYRVKIRGHGVDIREVEKTLLRHAGVKETVVVDDPGHAGERQLTAYFTSFDKPPPTVTDLRDFLSEMLPGYAIPAAFYALDKLPLTPNGKFDRNALPIPGTSRPNLSTQFTAPTFPNEQKLAAIWAEVLGIEKVGIHDNFFDLGGQSLSAARVVSRVIEAFQLELPARVIFDTPTVAAMASVITQSQAKVTNNLALTQMLDELDGISDEDAKTIFADNVASKNKGR